MSRTLVERVTLDGVLSSFWLAMGSSHWPSNDPSDSPFNTYTCDWCGWIKVHQAYGGFTVAVPCEDPEPALRWHMANCPMRPAAPPAAAPLTWTAERPTVSGWYWVLCGDAITPSILEVTLASMFPIWLGDEGFTFDAFPFARWAGPLVPPDPGPPVPPETP